MRQLVRLIILALLLVTSACERKSPNDSTFSTLFMAAEHGDVSAIRDLIAKGHKLEEVDSHGKTPLAYAVMGHHMDAAKALISAGANADVRTRKGYDLVMLSLYTEMDPSLDMLNYVVSLGLSVNQTTADGDSALNIAISSQNEKAVIRLISLGATPNEKSIEILNNQTRPNLTIFKLINDLGKAKGIVSVQHE